jgi:hypothetical protein
MTLYIHSKISDLPENTIRDHFSKVLFILTAHCHESLKCFKMRPFNDNFYFQKHELSYIWSNWVNTVNVLTTAFLHCQKLFYKSAMWEGTLLWCKIHFSCQRFSFFQKMQCSVACLFWRDKFITEIYISNKWISIISALDFYICDFLVRHSGHFHCTLWDFLSHSY